MNCKRLRSQHPNRADLLRQEIAMALQERIFSRVSALRLKASNYSPEGASTLPTCSQTNYLLQPPKILRPSLPTCICSLFDHLDRELEHVGNPFSAPPEVTGGCGTKSQESRGFQSPVRLSDAFLVLGVSRRCNLNRSQGFQLLNSLVNLALIPTHSWLSRSIVWS